MIENIEKTSDDKVIGSEMDDGGRCLLDVINDPQLLQSFLENSNATNSVCNKDETSITPQIIANNSKPANKNEIKAKKSPVVAIKSSPSISNQNIDLNSIKKNDTLKSQSNIKIASNVANQNTLQSGFIMDNKQMINVGSSSLGMMPISLASLTNGIPANAQSIHQSICPTLSTNAIRGSNPTVFPHAQIQLGPRPVTVLPQQLIMPGVQMGQHTGISQFLLTSRPQNPASAIQPGQVLQIIQTSQGTQIVSANPTSNIQQFVTTSASNVKTTNSNSRSNKQILPKPLSNSLSVVSSQCNSASKNSVSQASNIKLINTIHQPNGSAAAFNTQQLNTATNVNSTHQFLIGSGGQHAGIITSPQGTFLLNNMVPNIGTQSFLLQGNVQNSPVQLAIRPQTPLFVNSNTLNGDQANLSLALSGTSQVSTSKPQATQSPHTLVLSNSNTPVSNANGLVMGTNIRQSAPNIFIRPQLIGAQQPPPPSQPQFLQIQTPNGPLLVAVNSTPQQMAPQTIIGPQASSNVQPSTIQIGNTVFSLAANPSLNMQSGSNPLQNLLNQSSENPVAITNSNIVQPNIATSVSTSSSIIINSPSSLLSKSQAPLVSPGIQVVSQQTPKTNQTKGLNLADLLKETGILSDFSPPTSPKSVASVNTNLNSSTAELSSQNASTPTDIQQQQQNITQQPAVFMVPGGLNSQQNLLIQPNTPAPQFRLSVAPDGTLVLLSPNSSSVASNQSQGSSGKSISLSNKDPSGLGSSQPSPDSTTPSIEANNSSPSTSIPQTISSACDKKPISIAPSKGDVMNDNSSLKYTYDKSITDTSLNNTFDKGKTGVIASDQNINENNVPVVLVSTNSLALSQLQPVFTNRSVLSDTCTVTTSCVDSILVTSNASSTSQSNNNLTSQAFVANNQNLVSSQVPSVVLFDQKGLLLSQITLNNKDFIVRLENQLKNLLTVKNPTVPQQELTQELINLQQKINLLNSATVSNITSIHVNLSVAAQQLLQVTKQLSSNPQQLSLATNQFGNILISNKTQNNDNVQIVINQNQLKTNSFQLVSNSIKNPPLNIISSLNESIKNANSISPNIVTLANTSNQHAGDSNQVLNANTYTNQVKKLPDQEKNKPNVLKAIQQQSNADQNSALHPDCKTPFKSRDDACKRLLRYHVFDSPTWTEDKFKKFDELFEEISQILLHKKSQLYNKYQYLLLKQSMKESPSCEHVMLGRMFVYEETDSLKSDRENVDSGNVLDLPPVPESWLNISSEQEDSVSLKRKAPSDELEEEIDQSSNDQFRKQDFTDLCDIFDDDKALLNSESDETKMNFLSNLLPEMNNSRNHDLSSVDELINQLNSPSCTDSNQEQILNNDHQNFLDSFDNVPLNHNSFIEDSSNSLNINTDEMGMFYSGVNTNENLDRTTSDLEWSTDLQCTSSLNSMQNNMLVNTSETNNSQISWNTRYNVNETEADVAVQSIMNSTNDVPDMSMDLSGIEDLDGNMDVENPTNFDQTECGDSALLESDSMSQQNFDVQMHCAIKSIMIPSPTSLGPMSTSSSSNSTNNYHHSNQSSYHHHISTSIGNSNFTNISYHSSSHQMMSGHMSMRTNNMISYQSSAVNDPMLDEAVKSILS